MVSAAAPVGATRVFSNYSTYEEAWKALPTAAIVVDGPERSRSIVLLGQTHETRTSDRLRFARVAPAGTLLETRQLGEGQALALARAPRGYALIMPSPASELPCGIRLLTLLGGAVSVGPTAPVPYCAFPRVVLARNESGFVTVLPGCAASGRGKELIAIVFDEQGTVAPESTLLLDEAADRGFDVIEDRGHAWLTYAAIEARTARTQVLLEPLGTDARPQTAFVVHDGYDPVRAVQLGGAGRMSALLVMREATTSLLDLTRFADGRGFPQVRPVTTHRAAPCSESPNSGGVHP